MKICLTGASGLLGSKFKERIDQISCYTLVVLDHNRILAASISDLQSELKDVDLLIHCAAATNVERCEQEKEWCYTGNTFLTEKLCRSTRATILYVSSTGVYGSNLASPCIEYDPVTPTTVHHRAKLAAEDFVKSHSASNIIIRTGWLYGSRPANDFVNKIYSEMQVCDGPIRSNKDQYGCPTLTGSVVARCFEIIKNDGFGVFNVVNSGAASRYDYVCAIRDCLSPSTEVLPVSSEYFKRIAPVPKNESARSIRIQCFGLNELSDWRVELKKYLEATY